MYPDILYFGPNVPIEGLLEGQCIYYMSTWTLRVSERWWGPVGDSWARNVDDGIVFFFGGLARWSSVGTG